MTSKNDSSVLSIKEASTIAGVSDRTIRRWIDKGFIKDLRQSNDKHSSIVIGRHDLQVYLAGLSMPLDSHDKSACQGEISALKGQVATQQILIEELQADKRRLLFEIATLRKQLEDSFDARSSLEKELNGGVRGLLKWIWK